MVPQSYPDRTWVPNLKDEKPAETHDRRLLLTPHSPPSPATTLGIFIINSREFELANSRHVTPATPSQHRFNQAATRLRLIGPKPPPAGFRWKPSAKDGPE